MTDLGRDVIEALEDILGKNRVSASKLDLAAYSRDIWPQGYFWIREGKAPYLPDAVVWPEKTEEVSSVIKLAVAKKIPVTPVGAGSGVCGGTIPVRGGIVLDLKRMNRLRRASANAAPSSPPPPAEKVRRSGRETSGRKGICQ